MVYALNSKWWNQWATYSNFITTSLYEDINSLSSYHSRSSVTVNFNIAQKIITNNYDEMRAKKPE